jgi:hypothetical protein
MENRSLCKQCLVRNTPFPGAPLCKECFSKKRQTTGTCSDCKIRFDNKGWMPRCDACFIRSKRAERMPSKTCNKCGTTFKAKTIGETICSSCENSANSDSSGSSENSNHTCSTCKANPCTCTKCKFCDQKKCMCASCRACKATTRMLSNGICLLCQTKGFSECKNCKAVTRTTNGLCVICQFVSKRPCKTCKKEIVNTKLLDGLCFACLSEKKRPLTECPTCGKQTDGFCCIVPYLSTTSSAAIQHLLKHQKDFHTCLEVPKDSSVSDIRKSYIRLSLLVHPDKAKKEAHAVQAFQILQNAYQRLLNADTRHLY